MKGSGGIPPFILTLGISSFMPQLLYPWGRSLRHPLNRSQSLKCWLAWSSCQPEKVLLNCWYVFTVFFWHTVSRRRVGWKDIWLYIDMRLVKLKMYTSSAANIMLLCHLWHCTWKCTHAVLQTLCCCAICGTALEHAGPLKWLSDHCVYLRFLFIKHWWWSLCWK
jgi:hypothetical protein